MKTIEATLPKDVRYFVCHDKGEIRESAKRIPARTKLHLEPAVKTNVDGHVHDAAPFEKNGEVRLVIVSEIGIPGLLAKLRATQKLSTVK